MKDLCVDAGLDVRVGPQIGRFEAEIETDTLPQLASRIDHLRERILDELAERPYFPVPHVDSHFYGQTEPFGREVATRFTGSSEEFQEAAKCLSLQQSTACVFHLMRGMEAAVQHLAVVLGMTINLGTTWRQITHKMDAHIQLMPNTTPTQNTEKENWANARAQLDNLGSAQRNKTMHPSASYTQEEARHIFSSSGFVMRALCNL